jgi:nicotinamide phosphoribosyltransferase
MTTYPLTNADAYKLSHAGFMDKRTEKIYSNLTPRTSKYMPLSPSFFDGNAVFFGLQYFIKDYLIDEWNKEFFQKPKDEVIKKFKRRVDTFLGKGSVSMEKFENLHDLGYLPIKIKALPEGASVPMRVPFLTIVNTHNDYAWLTNYLETVLSCDLWKPCFTATLVKSFKQLINIYADETVGSRDHTMFQLHGFEFRGMSGRHDAKISGAGLLLSSYGTDTVSAIDFLEEYYNADAEKEFIAASVPASEHAVTSLETALTSELEFFRKAITIDYPSGIVSLVSDTYDFFKIVTEFVVELKEDILNRPINELGMAKVVFRPDSGDPIKIVCGDPDAPKDSPEYKGAIECLWDVFGGTISEKGYKVLHERVGLIYGDSCTQPIIHGILEGLKQKGFASSNIVFGVGSYSMNYATRDSLGIAQKATWAQVEGKGYDLYKDPKTDTGMKKSARGLLRVDLIDGEYVLKDQCTREEEEGGELQVVFSDGKITKDWTLSEIRERVAKNF